MNQKEREYLQEVYKDCMMLTKKGDLTEYGFGTGDLAALLLEKRPISRWKR